MKNFICKHLDKKEGHTEKSGVTVLRIALDGLGDYFRMPR